MPVFLAAATERTAIMLDLVIMLIADKLMSAIFEGFHQPAVVWEIIGGILVDSLLNRF